MKAIDPNDLLQVKKCACFNLRKATRAVTQIYDAALQELGLRATQLSILVAAQSQDKVSISEAADSMVMDRTTLTRNLKPLVNRGLIAITQGKDRRTKAIVITEEGGNVLSLALPLWKKAQKQVVERFGKKKFEAFLMDLSEFINVNRV